LNPATTKELPFKNPDASLPQSSSQSHRIAILSHILPPSPSGQAIVLFRILKGIDPAGYCLLSRNDYTHRDSTLSTTHNQLQAPYFHITSGAGHGGNRKPRQFRYGSRLIRYRNALSIVYKMHRLLVDQHCNAIITCTGDLYDIPAGFIASRLARIPFYAYIFDDYVYQWTGHHRQVARIIASIVFRRAEKVIVPNEFLGKEYAERYNIHPVVIHNPCAPEHLEKKATVSWPDEEGVVKIVYTGAIYHAHFDAFRNLISALHRLGRKDIQLHLYTSQPRGDLEAKGISGINVFFHPHEDYSGIMEVQERADILFLPLAFDSSIPEVIRTSAPGKLGEYLASRRPILAHAPCDSFISWYIRTHDCGMIVDCNDPEKVKEGIVKMLSDAELRDRYTLNAYNRALIDFNPAMAQEHFINLFSLKKALDE
jgi:glycosyltransferase involved in cell wall biosynthesis